MISGYMIRKITSSALLGSILFAFTFCSDYENDIIPENSSGDQGTEATSIQAPSLLYGIDTTDLDIIEGRIRRNQFLSEILNRYGISYTDLNSIIENSGETLDLRNIKAGNRYTLLLHRDSTAKAAYMVYNDSPETTYILDFTDSLKIRRINSEIAIRLKYSSGVIETSLWNAMVEKNMSPLLAIELSEIYAWTIDFFGLQAKDRFKIIYEEQFIDSIPNGITKIYGAWFSHSGTEFYAIPIIQNGVESYYDLEGNSLKKAFLKAPLRYSRISSRFSNSRMHPILRIRRPHHGVDYAAPIGTPVLAVGDGRVIMTEYQSGSGRIVKVRHNSVYTTAYMHLSRYGKGISVGKYVKQGDIVGYVGSSGLSTGPHLDFRFYKNGYAVDPLKIKAPPVEPVSEENLEKFKKVNSVIKQLLDSIE